MGGPAYAMYEFEPPAALGPDSDREPTEERMGRGRSEAASAGGSATASPIEGTISDIVTTSPFDRDEFEDVPGYTIPKPHNVHTTVGVRWKF